jgi:hypothetical protein
MTGGVGRGSRGAALVGTAVFSHWVLDFVVNRPDLPLMAFGLEAALLLLGLRLYLARRPERGVGLAVFSLLMLAAQAMVFFGPPPASGSQIAATALVSYLVFAFVAWWLAERGRAG